MIAHVVLVLCGVLGIGSAHATRVGADAPAAAYVVVTHATVQRAGRLRFALASFSLVRAMRGTPGLRHQQQGIRRFGAEVWTITAWDEPASMRAFVRGPEHAGAMRDAAFAIVAMETWHLDCGTSTFPGSFRDVERLRAGEVPAGCRLRDAAGRP